MFSYADKDLNGFIDQNEMQKLINFLNINISESMLTKSAETDSKNLNYKQFKTLISNLLYKSELLDYASHFLDPNTGNIKPENFE